MDFPLQANSKDADWPLPRHRGETTKHPSLVCESPSQSAFGFWLTHCNCSTPGLYRFRPAFWISFLKWVRKTSLSGKQAASSDFTEMSMCSIILHYFMVWSPYWVWYQNMITYKYKDHDQEKDAIGRNDMYDKIGFQVGEWWKNVLGSTCQISWYRISIPKNSNVDVLLSSYAHTM